MYLFTLYSVFVKFVLWACVISLCELLLSILTVESHFSLFFFLGGHVACLTMSELYQQSIRQNARLIKGIPPMDFEICALFTFINILTLFYHFCSHFQ